MVSSQAAAAARRHCLPVAAAAFVWLWPLAVAAKPCDNPDDPARITGAKECLVVRAFPSPGELSSPVLVAVMHGDVSSGGPAKYHVDFARKLAEQEKNLVAVAMIRPGYDDGDGNTSSGEHTNRSDHYTADNVDAMADGVRRLRERYQASRVVLVGHSGGAATSAVILGRRPGVADAAVLVACPCNIGEWRRGRRPWSRSESPHEWAGKVPPSARVIAITGADDSNTKPSLAEDYVALLKKRGVDARFVVVPGADHNAAWFGPAVMDAVTELTR